MAILSALRRSHEAAVQRLISDDVLTAPGVTDAQAEAQRVEEAREATRAAAERALRGAGDDQRVVANHRAASLYERLHSGCEPYVQQLRIVFESAEARERERSWLRLQSTGELDDTRLVDAHVGERQIFKRRGTPPVRLGAHQTKPKAITFLLDASASMSRGDAADGRLQRMGQTAVMLMEALRGFEHKFEYSILGHSGSSAALPLVTAGQPPSSTAERAAVVEMLFSHSSACASGDNSLEAARRAIEELAAQDADERLVFLLSDANLGRYGVSPEDLGGVLRSHPKVSAYAIFVAEPLAAKWLAEQLPFGRGFSVNDVAKLPNTIQEIFAHASTLSVDH